MTPLKLAKKIVFPGKKQWGRLQEIVPMERALGYGIREECASRPSNVHSKQASQQGVRTGWRE
jgi:hypothetical protein